MKRTTYKYWQIFILSFVFSFCLTFLSISIITRCMDKGVESEVTINIQEEPVTKKVQEELLMKKVQEEILMKKVQEELLMKEVQVESTAAPILTEEEIINGYIKNICESYNIEPELIESIVYYESRYQPNVNSGNCVGLMQVSTYWHADRAKKLGVTNFYDPYSNILVGVDYLSELFKKYEDITLVLMLYNMDHNTAFKLYKQGTVSNYARLILTRTEELKLGGGTNECKFLRKISANQRDEDRLRLRPKRVKIS